MTSVSIPGIYGRSNPYCSIQLGSFGLFLSYRRELWGLFQLPIYPIAHPYDMGACQTHAFQAALLGSRSVLSAVGLQISALLQKAHPIFSLGLWCLWEMHSQGLLVNNRCDALEAFPPPCIKVATLLFRRLMSIDCCSLDTSGRLRQECIALYTLSPKEAWPWHSISKHSSSPSLLLSTMSHLTLSVYGGPPAHMSDAEGRCLGWRPSGVVVCHGKAIAASCVMSQTLAVLVPTC